MTTKRKLIITTLAKTGTSTLTDLVDATGLERRNLQDNLKACVEDGLVDKLKDVEDGLPVVVYKVSTKGQQWLKNNQHSSVTTPAGGGDISPASAHCSTSLASVAPGKGADVIEPPKPDKAPAAVRSDDSALSKSVTEFCAWLGRRAKMRMPMNLREAKSVIDDLMQINLDHINSLTKQVNSKQDDIEELLRVGRRNETFASYVVMPDYPDMTIHQSLETARAEAEAEAMENSPVHVVAIVDTAEVAIKWKNAA